MLAVQRALEEGRLRGPLARAAAAMWSRACAPSVVRRLVLPVGVRVVCVGGATLGGSGKTPLAIACAATLARAGERVALVGHAYRARPGRARIVSPEDALSEVGDEALLAARWLAPLGARVVVAPRRADAVALAARHADALVLDGVAQTFPARADLALLAVDPDEPWGRAAALPPCGDLRAPIPTLLAACDRVVPVGEPKSFPSSRLRVPLSLSTARMGFACALARPERILRALASQGVTPLVIARAPDHGPFDHATVSRARAHARAAHLDVWLATPKCALHLHGLDLGAPVALLDRTITLDPALRATLLAKHGAAGAMA